MTQQCLSVPGCHLWVTEFCFCLPGWGTPPSAAGNMDPPLGLIQRGFGGRQGHRHLQVRIHTWMELLPAENCSHESTWEVRTMEKSAQVHKDPWRTKARFNMGLQSNPKPGPAWVQKDPSPGSTWIPEGSLENQGKVQHGVQNSPWGAETWLGLERSLRIQGQVQHDPERSKPGFNMGSRRIL